MFETKKEMRWRRDPDLSPLADPENKRCPENLSCILALHRWRSCWDVKQLFVKMVCDYFNIRSSIYTIKSPLINFELSFEKGNGEAKIIYKK